MSDAKTEKISLRNIFARFRAKIILTWFLVICEAGLLLLFPLFIGIAIDDFLADSYLGLVQLAGIGLLSLIVGAGRRFYDTRAYANIYTTIAPELVEKEKKRDASVSVVSARAGLATEFVEFFENSFPEIINSIIALGGALLIILFLNFKIFIACLIVTAVIGLIYSLTSTKTYRLNRGYNAELEKRVKVLEQGDKNGVVGHFKNVMRWNIRLSDLETTNFSLSWVFLIGVLLYAIVAIIESGVTAHGKVFSILMYVFNYIESVITMPLFYQQFVRLKEISHRLEGLDERQTPQQDI